MNTKRGGAGLRRNISKDMNFTSPLSHLQQAVAHERHQQLVAVALAQHGGVLRGVHAGEVEHGDVGLAVVVDGEVQRGQLVVGGEIGSLAGVGQQGRLVHVGPGQQQLCVGIVLQRGRAPLEEEAACDVTTQDGARESREKLMLAKSVTDIMPLLHGTQKTPFTLYNSQSAWRYLLWIRRNMLLSSIENTLRLEIVWLTK